MRCALFPSLIALLLATGLSAQTIIPRGIVTSETGEPLVSATLMLLQVQDSVLASFGVTDDKGRFQMQKVDPGSYLLQISYVGYATRTDTLMLNEANKNPDLGVIRLSSSSSQIEEVTVTDKRPPVLLKKDTIEFDAASFGTRPNATVEDLLKELPGVEVDNDGNIKAQGENVKEVLVDGKSFFGRDPKVAIKNLPADAVDKVQVFDRKSDQAEFTGIDDGQEQKAINLELKPDRRKGAFGKIAGGYGDQGRFETNANINRFKESTQLSFLSQANNINQQGFSFGDYLSFMGGAQAMRSGRIRKGDTGVPINFGQPELGFTTTYASGLNFNHEFGTKTEIQSSYFYARFDKNIATDVARETFLSDENFLTDEQTQENSINDNHRVDVELDHQLDSTSNIQFITRLSYNQTESRTQLDAESIDAKGDPRNTTVQDNTAEGDIFNINNNLLYRKRFEKPGRTLTTELRFVFNKNQIDGLNNSVNTFFRGGQRADSILQRFDQRTDNRTLGAEARYTEPMRKDQFLETFYDFSRRQTDFERAVFDRTSTNGGEESFNPALSNRYDGTYTYHRGGLRYRIVGDASNLSLEAGLQHTDLFGDLPLIEAKVDQSFTNFLPGLTWNYNFSSSRNLRIDYRTNIDEPSIEQLTPVIDNTDPLNIYIGNPNLEPAYRHRLSARYFAFSTLTNRVFIFSTSFIYTRNKIQNFVEIDENLVRVSTPLNVDNDYNLRSFLNYGFQLPRLDSRLNFSGNISYHIGFNLVEGEESQQRQLNTNAKFNWNYEPNKRIDFNAGYNLGYNQTRYEIGVQANGDFLQHVVFSELNLTLPARLFLGTDLNYTFNRGLQDDFNQDIPIWNARLSRFFLPGDRLELSFAIRDLLNQNQRVSQNANVNFVEDVNTNALGRFFTAGLTYSLTPLNPEKKGGRGMFRMIK